MTELSLSPEQELRARELHDDLIVIDMLTESSFPENLFEDMVEGGLTCGSFTIGAFGLDHLIGGTIPLLRDWWSWEATTRDLGIWQKIFKNPANPVLHIRSVADIHQAKADGKAGILINTQNSVCVGQDLDNIDHFYHLGLRVMQITYNLQNFMASGCLEDPRNKLSEFGIQSIGRMNEIGMLVDTGHTGDGSIKHAAQVSEKPISCSHAGLKSLSKAENPRVVSDSALRAVAECGGVFGLSAIPGMLTGNTRCSINDYVDHMQHAINVMGIDGVGIGSDFIAGAELSQIASSPDWQGQQVPTSLEVWPVCAGHEGFENHAKYPNLTHALLERGFTDEEIRKLMGGNWLRLLQDTIG